MSITDELRRYVKDHTNWDVALTTYPPQRTMTYHEGAMDAIADRIDAETERECHEQYVCGAEHGIVASIEASMIQERGYIELPKDADGEPIHIGDVLAPPADCDDYVPLQVMSLTYDGYEKEWFFDGEAGGFCGLTGQHMDVAGWTHYRKPTVEDVLTDLCEHVWESALLGSTWSDSPVESCITEYAAKLRLAESEES